MSKRNYVIVLSALIYMSCNNDGLFGRSKNKEESNANGSLVKEYIPDTKKIVLLDGTSMYIDTAWAEVSYTYHGGKRVLDTAYGYNFSIPVKNDNIKRFTFTFSLLDTTNRVFTNPGPDKDGLTQLCPRYLHDKMEILLKQKNPDTTYGWLKPIVTDTIIFSIIK